MIDKLRVERSFGRRLQAQDQDHYQRERANAKPHSDVEGQDENVFDAGPRRLPENQHRPDKRI